MVKFGEICVTNGSSTLCMRFDQWVGLTPQPNRTFFFLKLGWPATVAGSAIGAHLELSLRDFLSRFQHKIQGRVKPIQICMDSCLLCPGKTWIKDPRQYSIFPWFLFRSSAKIHNPWFLRLEMKRSTKALRQLTEIWSHDCFRSRESEDWDSSAPTQNSPLILNKIAWFPACWIRNNEV